MSQDDMPTIADKEHESLCRMSWLSLQLAKRICNSFKDDPQLVGLTNEEVALILLDLAASHLREDLKPRKRRKKPAPEPQPVPPSAPREMPLDSMPGVTWTSALLMDGFTNKFSKAKVVDVFGLDPREIDGLLGTDPEVSISYFERVVRLRAILTPDDFRTWLHTANPNLGGDEPIEWLRTRRWQELADLVDDILVGSPS